MLCAGAILWVKWAWWCLHGERAEWKQESGRLCPVCHHLWTGIQPGSSAVSEPTLGYSFLITPFSGRIASPPASLKHDPHSSTFNMHSPSQGTLPSSSFFPTAGTPSLLKVFPPQSSEKCLPSLLQLEEWVLRAHTSTRERRQEGPALPPCNRLKKVEARALSPHLKKMEMLLVFSDLKWNLPSLPCFISSLLYIILSKLGLP